MIWGRLEQFGSITDDVCMVDMGLVAHTPLPSSKLCTERNSIMTALHTPLLGTLDMQDTPDKQTYDMKSRAGFSIGGSGGGVQSQGCNTDMRNVQQSHGSPKFGKKSNRDGGQICAVSK